MNNSTGFEVTKSEMRYEGVIATVRVDELRAADGETLTREVVSVTNSVGIVAVNQKRQICMLDQYRHPVGKSVREIPAGRCDKQGESSLEVAQRELLEEVGLTSNKWRSIGAMLSSAGILTESLELFLAEGVTVSDTDFKREAEEAAMIQSWIDLADAYTMAIDGSLTDSKTVIGILRAYAFLA